MDRPLTASIDMEMCKKNCEYWIEKFVWTYDSRRAEEGMDGWMPFTLWPRQREMLKFIEARVKAREDGLIEKSRDIGFTWLAAAFATHKWLFVPGFKTTFGSRLADLVDKRGVTDSILEKVRVITDRLPVWMLPAGFNRNACLSYMRLINPENGNEITGESGDNMGRGGRSSTYILDEAAFLEHGDMVDAATSANSDVRIWASTVNGMGNTFARKRFGRMRPDQIFRFHWTDDPRRDQAWAEAKKNSIEEWKWASEYDIDYSASVEGICIPARWVASAKVIKRLVVLEPLSQGVAGMDIGAGKARSVFVARFGPIVLPPVSWGDPDTIETANRGLDEAQRSTVKRADGSECKVGKLLYDSVGVGHGVTSVMQHQSRPGVKTFGTNTGATPTQRRWPDNETSEEKFVNLKAEAWWLMRERFKATHEMLLHIEGKEGGQLHPASDLISLPDDGTSPDSDALAAQIPLVRWNHNERGKIIIEKKSDLAKRGISSPDHADALALTFAEKFMPPPARFITSFHMAR